MSQSDHRLLLTHFERWLASKALTCDQSLVGELLDLRATYDDLEPTWWPDGSVQHLLLELWPRKGPVEAPASHDVISGLSLWFRFLRTTGRMSGRSADVAVLVKETRRAAPKMAEAAADRSAWSPNKAIFEWGERQGISLDGAASPEELQARVEAVTAGWNALPAHERVRLMPLAESDTMTGADRRAVASGIDDPIVGLILDFRHELPSGELPDPSVSSADFRRAPFLDALLGYLRWAEPGQPLTDTDNLRLAPAREVWGLLGLEEWERQHERVQLVPDRMPGVARVGVEAYLDERLAKPWRSASDVVALERLWWAAAAAGRSHLRGRKVYGDPTPPVSDDDWLGFGLAAVSGILDMLEGRAAQASIVYTLLRSYTRERAVVPWTEIGDFCTDWLFEPRFGVSAGRWDSWGRWAIHFVEDTGIVEVDEVGVRLTSAGDVFVSWWLTMMEA